MSKFSKIFWWFTLISSIIVIIDKLLATGVTDYHYLLVSLISLAVIDLSRHQGGN